MRKELRMKRSRPQPPFCFLDDMEMDHIQGYIPKNHTNNYCRPYWVSEFFVHGCLVGSPEIGYGAGFIGMTTLKILERFKHQVIKR
jgi:hypothetical protein